MNCVICKTGQISAGTTTVTLQRYGITVVIKNVPANICDNCEEYYLSEEMAEHVLKLAESALQKEPNESFITIQASSENIVGRVEA